jgi:hypothetical protein
MDLNISDYDAIDFSMLGTKRQRPMYLSKFTRFRNYEMKMENYPKDPHAYTEYFKSVMHTWVSAHQQVQYLNLDSMPHRDAILGTTHQLDELHHLHGANIATYAGEYKYHRRLTDFTVKQIKHYSELAAGDVFVASYPSNITTGSHPEFDLLLEHCLKHRIPVHIDGAWFGQCRNFQFDVSHPAVHSVSVSLSKALGMGSQRIGIRYAKHRPVGSISIMNDFNYCNVSDMWIGVEMMQHFGVDYWWANYGHLYSKVCQDFGLTESDSIHVGWQYDQDQNRHQIGIRTPLRFLIEGIVDLRGSDLGLNEIERNERK